jgi:hypothetical protein
VRTALTKRSLLQSGRVVSPKTVQNEILAKASRYFGKGGEGKAKNCQMKDDGAWDCSTNLKECFGVHLKIKRA